jgi:hypothetical protein
MNVITLAKKIIDYDSVAIPGNLEDQGSAGQVFVIVLIHAFDRVMDYVFVQQEAMLHALVLLHRI